MFYLICIILVLIIALLVVYQSKKYNNKLTHLSKNRPEISKIDYIKKLTDLNFERDAVELVYKLIKRYYSPTDFNIYPKDDLFKVYRIDGDEDVELLDRATSKLNLRKVTQNDINKI